MEKLPNRAYTFGENKNLPESLGRYRELREAGRNQGEKNAAVSSQPWLNDRGKSIVFDEI